jgi:hypothetical protein
MPTQKSAVPPEIYQLKVTLLGTSPPIWRRLLVPADVTLAQLHDVLQAAMGWEDGHMHEFSIGQRRFQRLDPEGRLMGIPLWKTNARCVSPAYSGGSVRRLFTRTILVIPGSIASSWRSGFQLIQIPRIRSARMVSLRVHRKIVEAFPDSMTWLRPSTTPTTNGTKKCSTGSATILIPKPYRLTRSTGCSRP